MIDKVLYSDAAATLRAFHQCKRIEDRVISSALRLVVRGTDNAVWPSSVGRVCARRVHNCSKRGKPGGRERTDTAKGRLKKLGQWPKGTKETHPRPINAVMLP